MDAGQWLIEQRAQLDRAEAMWLEQLVQFDRDGLWALDGQLNCVNWLVWRTNMARSTAFDKLRVAHELGRRPIVAEAFRQGRLSYSAVRAITRVDRPDPAVDEALVELAESGRASILDLERVVRSYHLYADQDRPPPDDAQRSRQVQVHRGEAGGAGQVVANLGQLELEEFSAVLQAFLDRRYRPRPVDESSAEDSTDQEAPAEEANRAERRADAFMDLVRAALAHADDGQAAGDDRYMVHLVTRSPGQGLSTLDGRPLHPADAAMVACDTSSVAHTLDASGEILNLGRKTRAWNTAQRRAISVRDGGCRFVGCHHTHYDIHHIRHWEHDGRTDVVNGCCFCRRHHRMLHLGYEAQGDPDGELRFYRPDGSYLGATYPASTRVLTSR